MRGLLTALHRLATPTPSLFLMGGLAEDALLHHTLTRPHDDVDGLIVRDELAARLRQLRSLGAADFETQLEEPPGHVLALSAHLDETTLDLWVCEPEPDGGYFLDVPGQPSPSLFRITLPADTFQHPITTLDGVTVQTVSPLALYHLRAASALTRHVGEKRAADEAMQERLRQAFLIGVDEQRLALKVVGV